MTQLEPVPMLDLAAETREVRADLDAAWARVVDSGRFVLGPDVDAFEQEAAAYLGVPHAVALNSGTDALLLALRAHDVGPGDEVVTTPFSFFATSEAVLSVGATPVFVDLAPGSFQLDPASVAAAITPRTRALLPVHLYGELAPMAHLRDLAQRHGLLLVEDAAQAFGARYRAPCAACPDPARCAAEADGGAAPFVGIAAGALGDVAAFSFYPTKNLGALGDGGLLTTHDAAVAARVRRLRNHGSEVRYVHEELGVNSRLDSLQAAALRAKLPRLDAWTAARRRVAARYDDALAGVDGLTPPRPTPGHVYHQYTVRIAGGRRDAVADALRTDGVATMVYYPHTLERYGGRAEGDLPNAHAAAAEALSLPVFPTLAAAAQDRVVAALKRALAGG